MSDKCKVFTSDKYRVFTYHYDEMPKSGYEQGRFIEEKINEHRDMGFAPVGVDTTRVGLGQAIHFLVQRIDKEEVKETEFIPDPDISPNEDKRITSEPAPTHLFCTSDGDWLPDVKVGKAYQVVPDASLKDYEVRIINERGDPAVYPRDCFSENNPYVLGGEEYQHIAERFKGRSALWKGVVERLLNEGVTDFKVQSVGDVVRIGWNEPTAGGS